ncbi:MAG: hypothetical protein M3N49_12830 [Candidatus Eremiobacteraeota bacterium]|nr:hypothetical protein [Candidatus Eremiobacteraeota bacterium]
MTTAFLSNDAGSSCARRRPHAYVFACALVANAASFVLPIANPSNLLFFGPRTS